MKNQFALAACTEAAETDVLIHHGIIGMKWGVRRFQPYPSDYDGDGKYAGKDKRNPLKEKIKAHKALKEAKAYREKKKRALNTLDYKTIVKHPDWYSDEEIASALIKSRAMKDIAENMSTAKGASVVKNSTAWNTTANAAKTTVGIGSGVLAAALIGYNIVEKADKIKAARKAAEITAKAAKVIAK